VRARADHYARLRKRLQQKGTRSATRKLVAISGRERRLKLNTNHVISKHIVQTHPHALIGVEELNGIRERTKRRKNRRRGTMMGQVSAKARKANQLPPSGRLPNCTACSPTKQCWRVRSV
jgi:putative transposase